jgi:hypothetical protein
MAKYDAAWINPDISDMGGWKGRHRMAILAPVGPERSIVGLLKGWIDYTNQHAARYESGIGDDGVLGPEWESIGRGILGLLNGESGRLDCGTLDSLIRNVLSSEGFDAN